MTAALLALLAAALANAPGAGPTLEVRVLERDHPRELWLSGRALACDGVVVEGAAEALAVVDARGVALGARRCRKVTVEDARVRWGSRARSFRGTLRIERRGGELAVVNEVGEEDYLRGVLPSELSPGSPQAMAAQAVVSRSFARAGRGRHGDHDLCDLAHCQVYLGREGEAVEADAAVAATAGLVLRDGRGAVLPGYFHSCCGGATSAPQDVFGEATTLRGVGDVGPEGPACAACPSATWTFTAGRGELAQALGVAARGPALEVAKRDAAGRVLQVRAFGRLYRGDTFASKVGRRFGWQALRSLRWDSVSEAGGRVRVRGRGQGHGVGLCQWGARGLAARGLDWRGILRHYFPEATVGE